MFGSHDHNPNDKGEPKFSKALIDRFKSMFKDSIMRGNRSALIYEDIPDTEGLDEGQIVAKVIDSKYAMELLYSNEDFINNVLKGNIYSEPLTSDSLEAIRDYIISNDLYEVSLSKDLLSGAKDLVPLHQFSRYMYFVSRLAIHLSLAVRDVIMVNAIKLIFEESFDQLFIIRGTAHKESLPKFLKAEGLEANIEFDPLDADSLRNMQFPLDRLIADKVLELRKDLNRWPLLYDDYLALLRLIPKSDLILAFNKSYSNLYPQDFDSVLKILEAGSEAMYFMFNKAVELSGYDGDLFDVRNV